MNDIMKTYLKMLHVFAPTAAQAEGTIFTLSTISTSSIEEVAEAAPDATKWFQLYIYKDRYESIAIVLNFYYIRTHRPRPTAVMISSVHVAFALFNRRPTLLEILYLLFSSFQYFALYGLPPNRLVRHKVNKKLRVHIWLSFVSVKSQKI